MNKLFISVGLVTILVALGGIAEAKGKKTRVCENWLPYATTRTDVKDAPKVWLCLDTAKPRLITEAKLVPVKDDDGNIRNLLVELGE